MQRRVWGEFERLYFLCDRTARVDVPHLAAWRDKVESVEYAVCACLGNEIVRNGLGAARGDRVDELDGKIGLNGVRAEGALPVRRGRPA